MGDDGGLVMVRMVYSVILRWLILKRKGFLFVLMEPNVMGL